MRLDLVLHLPPMGGVGGWEWGGGVRVGVLHFLPL